MTSLHGTVINIHHHGGTVRLEDGSLASIPANQLAANRPAYAASLAKRKPLELEITGLGRHRTVALASESDAQANAKESEGELDPLFEDAFEAKIGAYLKETQEWAPPDQAAPAERHFIRKKRRARLFEARADAT